MKYNLFIGRWSPFHNGHRYIIDSFVDNGKPVCIAIRDSNEKYPVSLRMAMIKSVYMDEIRKGLIKVIVIPDIEMVVVGRKVGYSIVEVPEMVETISGTEVRNSGSKEDLPLEVKELIESYEKINKNNH